MAERTGTMNTSADNPRAIEARIERTRVEMSETVDEIQARLSPDRLKHEAEQKVREATIGRMEDMAYMAKHKARSWRADVVDTIKSNPVPAALAGLGIGWLIMSGPKEDHYERESDYTRGYAGRRYTPGYGEEWAPRTYRYTDVEGEENMGERMSRTAEDVRWQAERKIDDVRSQAERKVDEVSSQAQHKADDVRTRAKQVAEQARARADELGAEAQQRVDEAEQQIDTLRREARHQVSHASRSMQELMQDNPLAVGAMALAIGAAIGLSMPSTNMENELMGETRDRVLDEARVTAEQTMEQVRHVAEEAKESAERAVQNVEQTAKESASNVKETAKTEAEKQNLTSSGGNRSQTGNA